MPVGKDGVEDDGGDEEDGEDGNPVIDVKPDQGLGNIGCLRSHPVHPNIGWWWYCWRTYCRPVLPWPCCTSPSHLPLPSNIEDWYVKHNPQHNGNDKTTQSSLAMPPETVQTSPPLGRMGVDSIFWKRLDRCKVCTTTKCVSYCYASEFWKLPACPTLEMIAPGILGHLVLKWWNKGQNISNGSWAAKAAPPAPIKIPLPPKSQPFPKSEMGCSP